MHHPHVSTRRRKGTGLAKTLSLGVIASLTAATLSLSGAVASADPDPVPPPADPAAPAAPGPAPAPAAPGAPVDPAAPGDAPAPPPPPPEPGRVNNALGGLSYVVPAGWQVSDNTNISYGQALLTKIPAAGAPPGPSDTSVLLGRLDLKLFAGAEADNAKAATRLASDMGEFFLPYAGTRINQAAGPLDAAGMPGAFSSYDVKFTDTTKPDGQIWAGVVGSTPSPDTPRSQRALPERWFVVWLGSATNPVDKGAAAVLAQSIRPYTAPPPPPPPEPDPNAPPPDPNAPKPRAGVGVPVQVDPATAPGLLPEG